MEDIHILPQGISDIDELELWMKNFYFLTLRQRKLSNDASIAQYGENNIVRYNKMKAALLSNDYQTEIITESTTYSDNVIDSILEMSNDYWENVIIKSRNAENVGLIIMIATNDPIRPITDYGISELDILEKKWINLQKISSDKRILSNQTAFSIFGIENINLYQSITNYINNKLEHQAAFDNDENIEEISPRKTVDTEIEKDLLQSSIRESLIEDELLSCSIYEQLQLESIYDITNKKLISKEEKRPVPFFSPSEMINFGIFSGEINLYSPKPDNDMIGNQSVFEWFKRYELVEEFTEVDSYLWVKKLNECYLNYDKIIRSGDNEKIAARKQSILELGWNPEIPFSIEAAIKANYRHRRENNIIDLTPYYENEIIDTKSDSGVDDIKPIFLFFNKNIFGNKSLILSMNLKSDNAHLFSNNSHFNCSLKDYAADGKYIISVMFLDEEAWNHLRNILYEIENHQNEFDIVSNQLYTALSVGNTINEICSALLKLFSYSHSKYIYHLYDGEYANIDINKIASMVNSMTNPNSIQKTNNLRESMFFNTASISDIKMDDKLAAIINESTNKSNFKKVKITVDGKGNLRIKTIKDINDEFFKCHRNLLSFEKSDNFESMKDELCKLKYLDNISVSRMKNKENKDYKEYADAHSRIMNDFNKYLKIVTINEPSFNFSTYYKQSEWYDDETVVSKGLLDWMLSILTKIIIK